MLDHSAIAPLLHMPVNDILKSLNLPPLPHIPPMPPLPHMPPLPTIDLSLLFKPLTDLLKGFGSGNFANAPFNPQDLFQGLQKAFEGVVQLGSQAMSVLAPLWTGPAATAALARGTELAGNGTNTSTQSVDISTGIGMATASVGKGLALLQGVIADFVATLLPMLPVIFTPPGIAAVMASATAHLSTGMAIVAETRAEITAHTAHMTIAGRPVPVAAIPTVAAQIPGLASTAVQTVASPIQSLIGGAGGIGGGGLAARSALGGGNGLHARRIEGVRDADTHSAGAGGGLGGVGGGGFAGAGAGSGSNPQPLAPRTAAESLASSSNPARTPGGKAGIDEEIVTRSSSAMPMGPMGAGAAGGASPATHNSAVDREHVVDARHTDEIVGDVASASPAVLGAVEPAVTQTIWDEPDEMET
ncbi:hypothetical protein [Williamsia sp. CHRR-6]|uniref:hypothetical protein n=1 Tax=Williamsia sp. CHRR-6 TaxID=2835871 RepID=UPI001BDAA87D|nr:hypothetical protein [Williamsia sp. CHRR-6]MBT0568574.1 hypothetical protein [Williamsia sp. CHRR-6]